MKFNSFEFIVFLAIAFGVLWRLSPYRKPYQWVLLAASYLFYGWWDWRFLLLMLASSVLDFTVGLQLGRSKHRKAWMAVSLVGNLGTLMFFKYYNFFVNSFADMLHVVGLHASMSTLNIILPVGISFYTFQTLSYSLDVYKGKIKPTTDWLAFLNYVSFFPQLVAGPIERAAAFLPQFYDRRTFRLAQATDGMRLLLYGLFKKMVIADNIGIRVDHIYLHADEHSGGTLLLASALFLVQLYADFSAYTDIARGVAKMLGYELMKNFKSPLFSRSIPEFWARWHISLTTWFRDYLFIWLAGLKRDSTLWRILSTVILFLVIGLWHGANYTFVVFGLVHGLAYLPRILSRKSKALRDTLQFLNTHSVVKHFTMLGNFVILSFTAVLFRSENIQQAKLIYHTMLSGLAGMDPDLLWALPYALGILLFEWMTQHTEHHFDVGRWHPWVRRPVYAALILAIFMLGYFGKEPFYYFQF
jgi:D-alanyl-lipoteichoic acid acyltransferase DltB (MBOAT superfamily)